MVDAAEGLLGIEWIEGKMVKKLLPCGTEEEFDSEGEIPQDSPNNEDENPLDEYGISLDTLMSLIGIEIAKMHLADIIHGDLTTSNMMLRHPTSFYSTDSNLSTELVLIDFGLSYHSTLIEDKAVDLYVLERAFASTHPDSEPMFASILSAYEKQMGREWPALRRRLDDGKTLIVLSVRITVLLPASVRLRGRKRSMVG
ncbi:hypothetical protein BDZ97DRAFT_1823370 [Flammula alnicola]|nr:hypothetical protein BDZ97DRAFT_1823370 [Flammula alnicola]